jgi:hypothetical protein
MIAVSLPRVAAFIHIFNQRTYLRTLTAHPPSISCRHHTRSPAADAPVSLLGLIRGPLPDLKQAPCCSPERSRSTYRVESSRDKKEKRRASGVAHPSQVRNALRERVHCVWLAGQPIPTTSLIALA